jgi:UDP:flavonoid glycosyltransferase YjiC (YdhE family)
VPLIWHGFGRLTARVGPMLHDNLAARLEARGHPVPLEQVTAIPVIDVCPPSLADPEFAGVAKTIPLRPTAVRVPGEPPAPAFPAGRRLVYLTLGTAFGSTDVLRAAIDGLSGLGSGGLGSGGLDLDVLVATGPMVDPRTLAAAPANVRVEAWVPQAAVLERADAIVHHGGSGTTLGAAAAGLPQLFLPQGADQFSNATMICDAGAGRQLAPADVTPEAVRDEVVALLDDQDVRARCRSLAREIAAMPAPVDVVERLVDWQRVAAGAS